MARASKSLESEWLPDTPLPTRSVIRRLAVPMVRLLIHEIRFPDEVLNEDIVGFPLVDTLPPVRYSCQDRPPKPRATPVTLEQLRAHRVALNLLVLSGVKELPYSDEVFDITCEDAEQGFMSEPVPIDTVDLSQVSLTRRIPCESFGRGADGLERWIIRLRA